MKGRGRSAVSPPLPTDLSSRIPGSRKRKKIGRKGRQTARLMREKIFDTVGESRTL
jgi:hypothetical protein